MKSALACGNVSYHLDSQTPGPGQCFQLSVYVVPAMGRSDLGIILVQTPRTHVVEQAIWRLGSASILSALDHDPAWSSHAEPHFLGSPKD